MAARVLLQRSSMAPLASMALAGLVFAPKNVYAEAPLDSYKKKSIYDDVDLPSTNPSAPTTTPPKKSQPAAEPVEEHKPHGPTPTDRLAVQIGNARVWLYKFAVCAEDKINETMDSAFDLEQSFTTTLASLAPSRESGEQLMPGAIYVLVAAMAGSIVTRRSNILLRASVPLATGIGAGYSVLPVTTRNVADLTWKYEQKVPVLAQAHLQAREALEKGVSFAKVHKDVGVQYVDDKVTDAREAVEGWVKQGK